MTSSALHHFRLSIKDKCVLILIGSYSPNVVAYISVICASIADIFSWPKIQLTVGAVLQCNLTDLCLI